MNFLLALKEQTLAPPTSAALPPPLLVPATAAPGVSKHVDALKGLFAPGSAPPLTRVRSNLDASMSALYLVNVNIKNKAGETALHQAVKSGSQEIVRALTSRWCDITVVSEQGDARAIAASFNQNVIAAALDDMTKKENANGRLPSEIWLRVFSFLPAETICAAARVCKQWRRISENDAVWRDKCRESHISRKGAMHSWKRIWKQEYLAVQEYKHQTEQTAKAHPQELTLLQSAAHAMSARVKYARIAKMKIARDKLVKELVETGKPLTFRLPLSSLV